MVHAHYAWPKPQNNDFSVICVFCTISLSVSFPLISPILYLYTWHRWCMFVIPLQKINWKEQSFHLLWWSYILSLLNVISKTKLDFIVLSSSSLYLIIILPGTIYLINSFLNSVKIFTHYQKIYLLISVYTQKWPNLLTASKSADWISDAFLKILKYKT